MQARHGALCVQRERINQYVVHWARVRVLRTFRFLFGEFCDGVHAFVCGIVCGSLIFVTPVGGTIDAICRAPLENVDHDVYISSCCGECVSDGQHLLAVRIVCATNARVGWRQAIVSYGCISQTHSCAPLWCACASVLFYVFVFASMC